MVLPHPSPRNGMWSIPRPWFNSEMLPALRERVKEVLKNEETLDVSGGFVYHDYRCFVGAWFLRASHSSFAGYDDSANGKARPGLPRGHSACLRELPLVRNPMALVQPRRSCIVDDSQRRERRAGFSELVPMGGVRHGRTKSASKQLSQADQRSHNASAALSVAPSSCEIERSGALGARRRVTVGVRPHHRTRASNAFDRIQSTRRPKCQRKIELSCWLRF